MKKNVLKTVCVFVTALSLSLSLCSCNWLDEMRRAQIFFTENNYSEIVWDGNTYVRTDVLSEWTSGRYYEDLYLTEPDVPVLLSEVHYLADASVDVEGYMITLPFSYYRADEVGSAFVPKPGEEYFHDQEHNRVVRYTESLYVRKDSLDYYLKNAENPEFGHISFGYGGWMQADEIEGFGAFETFALDFLKGFRPKELTCPDEYGAYEQGYETLVPLCLQDSMGMFEIGEAAFIAQTEKEAGYCLIVTEGPGAIAEEDPVTGEVIETELPSITKCPIPAAYERFVETLLQEYQDRESGFLF